MRITKKEKKMLDSLTEEEKKVLIVFGIDPFLDLYELSERTNIEQDKLKSILEKMTERELIIKRED